MPNVMTTNVPAVNISSGIYCAFRSSSSPQLSDLFFPKRTFITQKEFLAILTRVWCHFLLFFFPLFQLHPCIYFFKAEPPPPIVVCIIYIPLNNVTARFVVAFKNSRVEWNSEGEHWNPIMSLCGTAVRPCIWLKLNQDWGSGSVDPYTSESEFSWADPHPTLNV